jgi:hypothetical protein
LYVNYDPKQCDTGEPGREHNVPDLTCRFLFRVVDPESAPIRGAHLDYYQADQYGRIYIEGQLSLRGSKSNELEGTVAADGFEPTEVRAVCAGGLNGKMTIEQFVMLRRLNSGQ